MRASPTTMQRAQARGSRLVASMSALVGKSCADPEIVEFIFCLDGLNGAQIDTLNMGGGFRSS